MVGAELTCLPMRFSKFHHKRACEINLKIAKSFGYPYNEIQLSQDECCTSLDLSGTHWKLVCNSTNRSSIDRLSLLIQSFLKS
jgi:hypothetical protein